MTQLTKDNYFSIENRHVSNSRLNDFIKDKHFFYLKHYKGLIPPKKTDEMILGAAIDCWLTDCKASFDAKYLVLEAGVRRNKKNPPVGITELNSTQFNEIKAICEKVEEQDAYKALADHQKQVILTMPMELGKYFSGLCGILDFLKIDGKTAYITDLKSATRGDSPTKYYYHSIDFGYFRQLAFYDILVRYNFKDVENVVHRHLVANKDVDKIYNVYTYVFDEERIAMEKENILTNLLPALAKETEFAPSNVKWTDAVVIGSLNKDDEF